MSRGPFTLSGQYSVRENSSSRPVKFCGGAPLVQLLWVVAASIAQTNAFYRESCERSWEVLFYKRCANHYYPCPPARPLARPRSAHSDERPNIDEQALQRSIELLGEYASIPHLESQHIGIWKCVFPLVQYVLDAFMVPSDCSTFQHATRRAITVAVTADSPESPFCTL